LYQKTVTLNPDRLMAWKSAEHDIWRTMGVYAVDDVTNKRTLLQPGYFKLEEGKNFLDDFMVPFFEKVRGVVCAQNERFVIFAEPHVDIMNHSIEKAPEALNAEKFAWAPHWYDALTLILKQYISWVAVLPPSTVPKLTKSLIDKAVVRTMTEIKKSGKPNMYVLLGETGVPMNMADDDDEDDNAYIAPTMALERVMRAVERNNLGTTMWNYCPDNSWLEGDRWNGEDFSIRSTSGARKNRGLLSAVRPFAVRVGRNLEVISQSFDPTAYLKRYELIVRLNKDANTEGDSDMNGRNDIVIFLPLIHFTDPRVLSQSSAGIEENVFVQELTWKGLSFEKNKNNTRKLVIVNDLATQKFEDDVARVENQKES